jgi:hypothetical protein
VLLTFCCWIKVKTGYTKARVKMTSVVRYIRICLIVLIAMTTLTNLLGWPSMVIDDSFSNMFIPGQMLNVTQKRVLSGMSSHLMHEFGSITPQTHVLVLL